ncbi:MAG: hypothetical protein MSIBF_02895 [Candidatus Altiarchaeales archaeon IMC4]|nr:MAG: hypothetical protein MSIBF_02895 [Candidatus Altiarchaeales archaeon IMC4]
MGLMYIASTLESAGHNVKILDMPAEGLNEEGALKEVEDFKSDIVGVSSTTVSYRLARNFIKNVKSKLGIPVFIGGYQPTILPEYVIKDSGADYAVVGEGEQTVVELTESIEKGRKPENIRGACYMEGDSIRFAGRRKLCENLDEIQFPAWHLVKNCYGKLGSLLSISKPEEFANIISTRGCPYSCAFCAAPKIYNHTYRTRSVDNVIKEIEWHVENGRKYIYIQDDNFSVSPDRVEEFCKKVKHLDIEWYCLMRADSAPRLYKKISQAGCKIVYFGIESGSQRVLDFYNKKTTPEINKAAIQKANESNLITIGSFIVGAPVGGVEDEKLSLKLALESRVDIIEVNILTLFPGTKLWEDYNKIKPLPLEKETSIHEVENINTQERNKLIFNGFYHRPKHAITGIAKILKHHRRLGIENIKHAPEVINYITNRKRVCEDYPKGSEW